MIACKVKLGDLFVDAWEDNRVLLVVKIETMFEKYRFHFVNTQAQIRKTPYMHSEKDLFNYGYYTDKRYQ